MYAYYVYHGAATISVFYVNVASLMDEEFARLERMIREKRGRAAAHVVVAPIDTAQPCNPRSSSEISFDVRVYMEENNDGRMDQEQGQLESPSAGTGFETPGQQCLLNWEMGRITVDGCLLVGVSSNSGGNVFPLEELGIAGCKPIVKPQHLLPHQKPFSCR